MRPFSAWRETTCSSVNWLVSSVPCVRLKSNRVRKTIPSTTPRRYSWWILGPGIMPCSRRPLMRRPSASASKCCGNLRDPERHELAISCWPDIGADRDRRCPRRSRRFHTRCLGAGSAARRDHDGGVHGAEKQHLTIAGTRRREELRLRDRDDSPYRRQGRPYGNGARPENRALTQCEFAFRTGGISPDAVEPETGTARRRPDRHQP